MDEQGSSAGMVIVGRILKPRGLRGEMMAEVISDSPGRFSAGGVIYLGGQPHKIQRSSSLPRGRVAIKLEGIDSQSEAASLGDSFLMVPESMAPCLPDGKYYHFQIIGIDVYTRQGEYLGQITQILSPGANDVYVASRGGEELLIPALDEVILEVNLDRRAMTVDLPEGLR